MSPTESNIRVGSHFKLVLLAVVIFNIIFIGIMFYLSSQNPLTPAQNELFLISKDVVKMSMSALGGLLVGKAA